MQRTRARSQPQRSPVDGANRLRAPSALAPAAAFSFLPPLLPAFLASLFLIPFSLPLCPPTRRQVWAT